MNDNHFINSLKKLHNILSQNNLLNEQQEEDLIDNIDDLEEVSGSMDQLMSKKIINFDKDYLDLLCDLNSNIIDIEGDIMEISELSDSISKKIEK